jgi:SAM-dependent methyltransferase
MTESLTTIPSVSAQRLEGVRCPTCTGPTSSGDGEVVCLDCGASFAAGPGGVIDATEGGGSFVHGLDGQVESLVPILEALDPPECTEKVIERYAASAGVDVGNPVWEGRADLARVVDGADGVVVDIGAGFGTISTAVARSAAHVYAVDKSPGRARTTAARARAEGLSNVTAIHADGLTLPLGSGTCDLALLIGVLEWTGFGHDDPAASQAAVLSEASRVLRPGGTLLIGIENRFGAHYFLGAREEHTGLRFSSLLPRRVANAYSRALQGRKMTNYTYSRRALVELVRRAGLEPRVGVALPSYSEPQLSFDQEDFERAWRFYLRHTFRYSSAPRRVVGAAGRFLPARLFTPIAPTFWLVASKGGEPRKIPTVVTGSGDCGADIKLVDWDEGQIVRLARRTGKLRECVPLLDGWSARSWASSPLLRRNRLRRQRALLREAATLIAARERRPATPEVKQASLREASAGLEHVGDEISSATGAWCREQLAVLSAGELEMVSEHGDFAAVNLVVETPSLKLRDVDRRNGTSFGLPGSDAVVLATGVLCMSRDLKGRDLDVALSALVEARPEIATELGRLLWADFGAGTSVPAAVALTIGAVLRYTANNVRLPGIASFLERSAAGELASALQRLRPG